MKLSVVLPCYNSEKTIARQLDSLARQSWSEPWELIVSDNGSTDRTRAILEGYRQKICNFRVVDASHCRGGAYARNVGAAAAKADLLAFCDADDEIAPGWVAAMGEALARYELVGCRLDIKKLNSSWVQKSRGNPQQDGPQMIWYPPYLPHVASCCLGVRRSLYEDVGGFDESLSILEDTDFCFKIQLAGAQLHFVPDTVVHYRLRSKLRDIYRQSRNYAEHNVLLSKRYQSTGVGIPHPWQNYLRYWMLLLRTLTKICRPAGRGRLAWQLGRQIGRLHGVVKYRTPPV